MTQEEKIKDILHRHMMEHYFKDEDLVNEFKAIIREEKIKILEGLMENSIFATNVPKANMIKIISELREEGKEKGKV